jgi:hypothetical protein
MRSTRTTPSASTPSLDRLTVVTLKKVGDPADATDDLTYLAIDASGITAQLLGIPTNVLKLKIWDAAIRVNQAQDTSGTPGLDKLDWTTFFDNAEGLIPM